MESFILFTDKDIERFRNKAGYFLEGNDGVLKTRFKLPEYGFNYDRLERQIEFSKVIEFIDNDSLKDYIIKDLDNKRKDIIDREKCLENEKKSINNQIQYLELIKDCKTFKESFIKIIQTP